MDAQEPIHDEHTIIHEPRYWLITALAVVATALITGGGVWWWMDSRIVSERQVMESQLADLGGQIADMENQMSQDDEIDNPAAPSDTGDQPILTEGWKTYTSELFGIQFKYPEGMDVLEQDSEIYGKNIYIAKDKVVFYEIGSNNAFLWITEPSDYFVNDRNNLENVSESSVIVDGREFNKIEGDDYGRYEGSSAGKVINIFFDDFVIHAEERPGNGTQDFDVIETVNQMIDSIAFIE